jgi:hypothetical protein
MDQPGGDGAKEQSVQPTMAVARNDDQISLQFHRGPVELVGRVAVAGQRQVAGGGTAPLGFRPGPGRPGDNATGPGTNPSTSLACRGCRDTAIWLTAHDDCGRPRGTLHGDPASTSAATFGAEDTLREGVLRREGHRRSRLALPPMVDQLVLFVDSPGPCEDRGRSGARWCVSLTKRATRRPPW